MQEISMIAETMLSHAQHRLRTTATNLANVQTPGFKHMVSFAQADTSTANALAAPQSLARVHFGSGQMSQTGRALDLALSGSGFFAVRNGDEVSLTRAGRFERSAQGQLVTPQGHVLQASGGGDLLIGTGTIEVLPSGVLLEDGLPIGQIRIDHPVSTNDLVSAGGSLFQLAEGTQLDGSRQSEVQQGVLETSNVSWGTEMTELMALQRQMEAGAQLVRAYDSLLGQAANRFATGGRR